jgi:hypothetical protein
VKEHIEYFEKKSTSYHVLRWFRFQIGRLLNCFGANLEICAECGHLTTWEDHRLWGPFMLCPKCDSRSTTELEEDEKLEKLAGKGNGK